MDTDSTIPDDAGVRTTAEGLAALAGIKFPSLDPTEILETAAAGAAALSTCRVEASYCAHDGHMELCPAAQSEHTELTDALRQSSWTGKVDLAQYHWGRAFPLCHQDVVHGCIVLSAAATPVPEQLLLLELLAQQAGAALACAELHQRDVRRARQLNESNHDLASAVQRLEARGRVHESLEGALAGGSGQDGIVEALHRLTGVPVCVEDRFGNILAWSGPGRPQRHSKPRTTEREGFLHELTAQTAPVHVDGRVCVLVQPHAEILGVIALVTPDADEDHHYALLYGSMVLGLELSHRRNLAEMHLSLSRELVDDLLAGTDADGAYARAEALGYDLRHPHYVVVIHTGRSASKADIAAAGRAAANLHVNHLAGHHGNSIVLLTDGRPARQALARELTRQLGHDRSAVGIGPRCDAPAEFPQSFGKARRALNVRLRSARPQGVSDYDELGFYHLVDAAHSVGVAEEYVRRWLGPLLDYDEAKHADLVHTLSHYLECGGNYDESAAALHVHRSTLRYRLRRIAELTGVDLRDVDARFNLHAATRAWQFLTPEP
ncbi:helix-turn-helix domain-containing protein [Mycobacterium yunnanensis]|uniref:Helix-turn-helix domain-containing protein n=1 Tax=Mycobacterium yunnanensis TaxID=368477 RepID=A0A9X2Z760_9MYCO|nr:helix-turn-helix domain-containing protein [Mycobacterium yunnanensis]MCV7423914.1 helix-turn-helix domain-containing protein [Mycobacterium yunnanensis]